MKELHTDVSSPQRLATLSIDQLRQLRRKAVAIQRTLRGTPIRPRDKTQPLPLSFAQERLWFLDQLKLVGPAYNMPLALTIQGLLDVTALERALNDVQCRHESLRTHFASIGGSPVQIINPAQDFHIQIHDLTALPAHNRAVEARRLMNEEILRLFDLARGPLWRATLLKIDGQEHLLVVTMHHIVSDGWSLQILKRELSALYRAYAYGEPHRLPELSVQYADYTLWQRDYLQGELLEQHVNYWRAQLRGAPDHLSIPTDRPRPALPSFKGAYVSFSVPDTLRRELEAFARREDVTLFMVLLAAYQLLLARYSGQDDIVVGSALAGRTHPQAEALIGVFVNMLVLRTDLSGNPTFRNLVARVKQTTLDAYAHQDLPFEKLVEELRPERNLSRQPIFQVAIAYQNYPQETADVPGMTWSEFEVDNFTAFFDLTLHLYEMEGELRGHFEYATDLFDTETITRMAGHFRTLLEEIARDPACPIEQLRMLGPDERRQVLHDFNRTAVEHPPSTLVHSLFEEQARKAPDTPAVVTQKETFSYGKLNARANQVAHALRALGVRPDDRVAVYLERSTDLIVALLGTLKSGGAYVPLDVNYPQERISYMLRDCAPAVVVTREALQSKLPKTGAQALILDTDAAKIDRLPDTNIDAAGLGLEAGNLVYVIYTSGSTGTPKGVAVEHRNLLNLIHWHCTAFEIFPGCRCSVLAAVGFDATCWEIWPALAAGATLILAPPETSADPAKLLAWWAMQPLDVSFLPTPLAELAFRRHIQNAGLRTLLVGGDRLNSYPRALPYAVVNNYGPTECTVVATSGRIEDGDHVMHIGRPIDNTQVYVLDRQREPVPVGVAGELYIGGAGVARGYLNRPELSTERFITDPFRSDRNTRLYKTGDVCRWRANGTIEYIGRNDEQVKIRGNRIELGEIESQLRRHSEVSEAVVVIREDVPGDKRLVAYFTRRPTSNPSIEQLRAHLKAVLPDYMVPHAFVSLDTLPLTPNGKLDRRALPAPDHEAYSVAQYDPPQGAIEESLARIWQKLLSVPKVGRRDNFFEVGGHSLHGITLIAEIAEQFGVDLPTMAVFQHPTIEQMARELAVRRASGQGAISGDALEFDEGSL